MKDIDNWRVAPQVYKTQINHGPAPPPPMPDINLNCLTGGSAGAWQDWQSVYGGGVLQWLRWVFSDTGSLPSADVARMDHLRLERQRFCHIYDDTAYCYCGHVWHRVGIERPADVLPPGPPRRIVKP